MVRATVRVLQIVNIGFEAGGAEKSVRIIRDGLRARGHEVEVIATDLLLSSDKECFADHIVPAITGTAAARLRGYLWHRQAYAHVRAVMQRFRPDCVHLHTIGEFSPAVLAATRGTPRVLTVHGPEDWTRALLRWNLASASNGGSLSLSDRARYLYLRFLQRPAYLPRIRRVDRVLAPSRYFAEAVRVDVGRVPVHVLGNGIESLGEPEPVTGFRHLLYVGRLERVKGVHILLAATRRMLAEMPDVRLTVVGDGSQRAQLEAESEDLRQAGAVRFLGWQSEAVVAEQLGSAGVVVLPSLWPENFPTVALEALQLGRPLVASRVGGLPELVGPDNGALVAPGDPEELAAVLARLVRDPELLQQLGRGSAKRAADYGVEAFLDAVIRHYEEVGAPCAS